ncbi:hypothetical protein MIMGU_mgv1a014304mg [Erythranthe guttata]|uniref:Uncharacterized protein n=1 Tax=Erythranthe guttata TaxID=4155 RepID=A0A022RMP6_ERYGU|nr:hypothetical protein MIMGU_mgv1a014304mg [Erythranthe guttata]
MDEDMISSAEFNRKRKIQGEPMETPRPKHVCWDQRADHGSSSCSVTEQTKLVTKNLLGGSDAEFYKAYPSYTNTTPVSIEPSTSCVSWDGTSSAEISVYSLESRSVTKSSTGKSKPLSICEELDYLHEDDREFGGHADVSFSEHENDGIIDQFTDNQEDTKKLTIDKEFEEYFSMLMM